MISRRKAALTATLLFVITLLATGPSAHARPDKAYDDAIDKAVAYLKSRQAKDGTWSRAASPGITGIALAALFQSGKVGANDPSSENALKFIESMIDAKEGHIANVAGGGKGAFHKNYITSVNLIALQASKQEKYKAAIEKASAYLKKLQWDESQEKTPKDLVYGGVGYGPNTRPDMSNTMFFLDAMKASGVPATDPLYKKAIVFISRCQNLKGEHNDQPWAAKVNDGSFIYVLAQGKGKGKAPDPKDDKRPGYGSMTYAGLKMLTLCGLPKGDERFKKAFEWVSHHYTVDENPGRRELGGGKEGAEAQGLYYYLWTMAKCLDTLGVDEIIDGKGAKHDWRAEMAAALLKKQRKDGSWSNESGTWMEGNPDLTTAYALLALSHCRPKAK
jgi:squalene-hopene/tetraprenyl-beta-curcumene cyclase